VGGNATYVRTIFAQLDTDLTDVTRALVWSDEVIVFRQS
jgi:hypothetical protein